MSDFNHIDDIFKKGLSNYREEPPADMWDRISIEKEAGKPKGFWYKNLIIIGLLFIVIVSIVGYIYNRFNNKDSIIAQIEVPVSLIENEYNTHNTPPIMVDDFSSIAQTDIDDSDSSNTKSEILGVVKKKNISQHKTNFISKEKIKQDVLFVKEEAFVLSDKMRDINIETYEETSIISSTETDGNIDYYQTQIHSIDENVVHVVIAENNADSTFKPVNEMNVNGFNSDDLPKIKNKKHIMEVLPYYMFNYNQKNVNPVTNNDYVQFVKSNEAPEWTHNYGLLINYKFNNFIVQTGVGAHVKATKQSYNFQAINMVDTSLSYYDYHIVILPDPNNPNNTIITVDSTYILVSDTVYKNVLNQRVNKLSYLTIPLNIGYDFKVRNHSIRLIGGVSFAKLIKTDYHVLDLDKTEFFDTNSNFNKHVWSYNLAVNYSTLLSDNLSVYFQPEFSKDLTAVFKQNEIQFIYQTLGVKCGLVYKIK